MKADLSGQDFARMLSLIGAMSADLHKTLQGLTAGTHRSETVKGSSGGTAALTALKLCRLWVHMLLEEVQMATDIKEWDQVATVLTVRKEHSGAHNWLSVPMPVDGFNPLLILIEMLEES